VFVLSRTWSPLRSFLEMGRLEEESDTALVARAKEDPEAFGVLYERYMGRIYSYIYYRTGNHHDAEDLTAHTFHRALQHVAHYVDRGLPFSAWLYRIAHNLVANWHRDNSRRQVVSIDDLILSGSKREDPVAAAEEKERQNTLLRAIRRLPPERQELLILKFTEQMSNAEIARVMGRTEGAIKSLYHRTLVALREELQGVFEWEGPSTEESL
jgi:RNA polymerase sigma-70 factor (ECF subfamily)